MNFSGGGIHEVAALRSDGVLVAGHFDDSVTAEAAIAALTDYRAVWSTLNPLCELPEGHTLNPARLTRGRRAGAQHIARRTSLLFDFDPQRPKDTMSTDAEHDAALAQARECRDWLYSMGWPVLSLCDSGSGAHLRPMVEMDTSAEETRLVQRTLTALRQRFTLVDIGMWDLPRLCRYYPSWNRKSAENTAERPWRRSAVLEAGEQKPISVAQLEALCELMRVPTIQPTGDGIARPEAQEKFVRRFTAYCERLGVTVDAVRKLGDGTVFVQTEFCLLNETHTGSSCGVGVGLEGIRKNLCKHSGCAMPWGQWSRLVEQKYGQPMLLDGVIKMGNENKVEKVPGPSLNHADLAKDFLASELGKNFYRVYDVPGEPIASWSRTRWVISQSTSLLRSSVRDYLDCLHDSLPKPEGRDYRAKLKSAPFCRDVTTEADIKLPTIKTEAFDTNPYLLGLPNGTVADLRTGSVRPMGREDFISRRLYITPEKAMPTERWDRFLDEITLGNSELRAYLMRLCALCLTAIPFQGLFFFWGRGRNGKGVLLRLMLRILGKTFADSFRHRELTKPKNDDDRAKRSLNKLEGRRLVTVDEAVGNNLDLAMLKILSGGDTISAARMRQDDRQFRPTHKLILPTNERPDLPNDPAFQGRTHFVPFLADFSDPKKQDPNLEARLQAEAPGILAQLIRLCPSVIADGLRAPKVVTNATAELLEENDVTKQFQEDVLTDAPGQNVSFEAMEGAVQSWLSGGSGGPLHVHSRDHDRQVEKILTELKAKFAYKRLREGNRNRRVYFFVGVSFKAEGS